MDATVEQKASRSSIISDAQRLWDQTKDWDTVFALLYEKRPALKAKTFAGYCIAMDDLALLQWGRSQQVPCPWSASTLAFAASLNKVSFIDWMRNAEPPCPWNKIAACEAFYYGNLETLYYLYDQEAPYGVYMWILDSVNSCCLDFFNQYGKAWQSNQFDVPLHLTKPAKDKSK